MTYDAFIFWINKRDWEPWNAILKRDPCTYCARREAEIPGGEGRKWREGGATKMTIEHVVPRGLDLARPPGALNKVGACWTCNHGRNNLPLLAYLLWRRTQEIRFLPGEHNVRNRIWKAERRRRRAEQIKRASHAPALTWSLGQALREPASRCLAVDPVDGSTTG